MADFLVIEKHTPLPKENGPIALIGIDEGKDEGACVGHVGADVEKIFEEPEEREGQAVGLAVKKEKSGAQKRDQELTERAAENHKGVPEVAEEGMAGFVDDKVGVIEEEEAGIVAPGVEQEEKVEGEANAAAKTGNTRPVIGAIEGKFHKKSVTAAGSGAWGIAGGVASGERFLGTGRRPGTTGSVRRNALWGIVRGCRRRRNR